MNTSKEYLKKRKYFLDIPICREKILWKENSANKKIGFLWIVGDINFILFYFAKGIHQEKKKHVSHISEKNHKCQKQN